MLYKTLAQQCISDIREGKKPLNSRMPSLRDFKKQHNISMSSALNCYQYLESLGWLVSKPQSGYFVSHAVESTETPVLIQFQSQTSDPRITASPLGYTPMIDVIGPLGFARVEPAQLPLDKLQLSFKRASKRQNKSISLYPTFSGDNTLKRALSTHFNRYDIRFNSEDMVITNGCIDAIKTALEITTSPGDAIAISSPCYSGLLDLLTSLARKVVEIPSTATGIDLDQLEVHMQNSTVKAGLFCTSHMNPQGISMSAQQKQRLANLATQYQIPIIEDDVYIETAHDKVVPLPAKYWDQAGYILWCGSVSKTIAAGYRLGWCVPGKYLAQYIQQRTALNQSVASVIQVGIADFINNGDYVQHLKKIRFNLQKQTLDYHQWLKAHLPKGSKISQPSGGFSLWVQIPGLNSSALFQAAQDCQLDIRVGEHFSVLGLYLDCIRINIGFPLSETEDNNSLQQLEKLVQLIPQFIA